VATGDNVLLEFGLPFPPWMNKDEQNGFTQRLVWHLSYHRRFPLAVA
jgi:hypothetical protein